MCSQSRYNEMQIVFSSIISRLDRKLIAKKDYNK